ncbi:hypothetical protein Tco_1480870 [Tanacetum coccineum]
MSKHKKIYVTPSHTKKVFANIKRQGNDFSGRDTPLFQTMMVQAQEEGKGFVMPIVPQHTPTINQPSSSQPQKKQKPMKSNKQNTHDFQPSGLTEPMADETENVESIPTHSNDLLLSGEDRLKLNELMELDEEVTLIDETQEKNDDNLMFDIGVLDEQEVEVEKVVSTAEVTASATITTVDELSLAQTLIEIKAAKPKVVTIVAKTITIAVTRPKARGVVVQEPNYELAARLQAQEQEELTIKEMSKMFVELMDK